MDDRKVLGSMKAKSYLRAFALGLAAPTLLVAPPSSEARALRRGETVQHAWGSVGYHLSRGMKQIASEQRTTRRPA